MRTQLDTKIRAFTDGWNDRSHPFALTETAGEILKRAKLKKTSKTDH
jgi:hypothetical protein